ncbi:hypothetical protein AMS68_000932 [Peltaster fructicola]|uniref:Protein kinase domain-containing protein n=1 Tax=Peltaster fructicola TaxID=286661 RepID=A0A6H0XLB4_9PEZI|nr:hypothetical protein AMS68_000932 [Peltaster fructicola]
MANSIHADPPPPIVTEPTGINYATGPALGKGGFAICHRAERYDGSRPTGCLVALKIVKSKMEPAKLAQKFVTELQIHSKVSHPNIVTFYRAFSFQTSTYVVLQLCPNGSLADMLKRRRCLTLPEIRRFVIQICGAVKYLHQRHIVHRDLKTGNLFLDDNMNVKVGDFGLAALLVTEKEMEVKRRTTMCGTPNYLAPEILEKGKGHDERVDLWSIGVITYTLAVGKAPFHASSKEEIYKKLKQGDYKWPELSTTNNDISADLRETVASLLVPEEMRPSPDHIVSQNFFRIAFVPTSIPTGARERAPVWSEVAVPSAETRQRGWSDSWYKACEQSGVGFKTETKCFKLSGGERIRSIVHEMAMEAQLGTVPTMPIPSDVVYSSTVGDWKMSESPEPSESIEDRSRSTMLKEISHNEVSMPRTTTARRTGRDADIMPPPPRPSSRTARSASIRKTARTISEESARAEALRVAQDAAPVQSLRSSRSVAGPLTASTLRERSNTAGSGLATADRAEPAATMSRADSARRHADASLARRPRAATKKERPVSPKPDRFATLEEMRQVSPIKRTKLRAEEVQILPDGKLNRHSAVLQFPPPPRMERSLPVPRRQPSHRSTSLTGSDPQTVLRRLTVLRDNLASALAGAQKKTSKRDIEPEAVRLPFVSRWVDYSRKHGVGYVLEDGTVGCIINASAKANTPVTHVLVRNGQRWLGRVGKNLDSLDDIPIEIFEDRDQAGIQLMSLKSAAGGAIIDAERRRTLSVLWSKFGRYMCQSLDGEERVDQTDSNQLVRFYQRLGSVGIWAFLDGCLQVHFPDHTKLVLSADGTLLSATCITSEAAEYLSANSELLPHHVATRELVTGSIQSLLSEGGRVRARMVRANRIAEKLEFVLEAVAQWIDNGGLGCMDEHEGGNKLSWEGLMVKEGVKKMDRVTVGRTGGDLAPKLIE